MDLFLFFVVIVVVFLHSEFICHIHKRSFGQPKAQQNIGSQQLTENTLKICMDICKGFNYNEITINVICERVNQLFFGVRKKIQIKTSVYI